MSKNRIVVERYFDALNSADFSELREVFSHADTVTVMRNGKTVDSRRNPKDISPTGLSQLMVGEAKEYENVSYSSPGPLALELKNIRMSRDNGVIALDDFNIRLFAGQIYGLAGVGGNGQTELADILMGVRSANDGRFILLGEELKTPSRKKAKALEYQKYYTGGSIVLMILVLVAMFLILN